MAAKTQLAPGGFPGARYSFTAKNSNPQPIQKFIYWNGTLGMLAQSSLAHLPLQDGVQEPSTVSGWAFLFVDASDGDLKIKFGDGTVKTIAIDT